VSRISSAIGGTASASEASRRGPATHRRAGAGLTLLLAYAAGSVPVANLAAKATGGPDLRTVAGGTVSGTSLYAVSGFGTLAAAGCLELAKGALGPVLAGRGRPVLGALAAASAICGHDWSPWLRGKGGRGVSLLLGALAVLAPEGAALLATAMAAGRLVRQTGAGTFLALLSTPLLLARRRGRGGALVGSLLVAPVLAKRLVGSGNTLPDSFGVVLSRLVFDADRPRSASSATTAPAPTPVPPTLSEAPVADGPSTCR
jgi:glycerol-3-phosphate acyltransferase PlsY